MGKWHTGLLNSQKKIPNSKARSETIFLALFRIWNFPLSLEFLFGIWNFLSYPHLVVISVGRGAAVGGEVKRDTDLCNKVLVHAGGVAALLASYAESAAGGYLARPVLQG